MAANMFLKLEGITGSSADDQHSGWMEIDSWDLDITNNADLQKLGQASTQKGAKTVGTATVSPLKIVKPSDKATGTIMEFAMLGKIIDKATVHILRTGGEKEPYIEIICQPVVITSFDGGGSEGQEITDSLELSYEKISINWEGGDVEFTYNLTTQAKE